MFASSLGGTGISGRHPHPVGDAMCAFDPVYGQGITVAACQAEQLRSALASAPTTARATRRVQRGLAAVADLPWSVTIERGPEDADQRWHPEPATAGDGPLEAPDGPAGGRRRPGFSAGHRDRLPPDGPPRLLFSRPVVASMSRSLLHGVPTAAAAHRCWPKSSTRVPNCWQLTITDHPLGSVQDAHWRHPTRRVAAPLIAKPPA